MASEATRQPRRSEDKPEIVLGMLNAVHENGEVSQRALAGELGIALGLANAYLKRCIKKGYIKMRTAPANRYVYYLTPTGFAEKSYLTAEFLSQSFRFFRTARSQGTDMLRTCADRGWTRVALAGRSEFVEILTLCLGNHSVEIVGVVDPSPGGTIAGLKVVGDLADLAAVDAVIISDLSNPQASFERFRTRFSEDRVLTAPFMGVSESNVSLTMDDGA